MDEPLLWVGTLACVATASAALLPLRPRQRLALLACALLLAPTLVVADNWQSERLVELRDSPALLASALAAGALVVAGLCRLLLALPHWLPLLLIAALPFRVPIELAGSTANLLLPLYALLAAGLLAGLLRPEAVIPRPPPARGLARLLGPALALVVLAYGLQAGYADDLSIAVENVSFFFAPFAALYVLIAGARWDAGTLRRAVLVLAAEGALFTLVGIGQTLTGELLWNEKVIDGNEAHAYFRVNSLFFDPNIMGRYLAVTMVVLAGVVAFGGRPEVRRAAPLFALLLVGLVLTFSQTSMLALIAGLGVLVVAAWGLPRALLAAAVTVVALALAVFALGGGGLTAETTGRTGLVSGGLELAGDRPLAGHGSGSFPEEFESRFGGGDGIAVESHTEPVTVAAEQGVIGLLPYAFLLGVSVAAMWASAGLGRRPTRRAVAATLLAGYGAMLVHSLGYAAFFSDPITWALLALATALSAAATSRAPGPGPALPRAARAQPAPDPA